MSVFYHEDPSRSFEEEYAYERELEEWILALGRLDNQHGFYRRFTKACEDTKERISAVRRQWQKAQVKERVWMYVFYALCAVWMLLVLIFGITGRDYLLGHKLLTMGLPVGGMSAIIVGVRSYFKGMGTMLSSLMGLLGAASSLIPIYIISTVQASSPGMLNVVVVAITAVYMLICHFTAFRESSMANTKEIQNLLKDDDVKSSLIEPLYYTFKTKSRRYKSSKFGMLDELSDHVDSLAGESVMHYVLWSVLAFILVLEFCVFSSSLLDVNLP